MWPIVKLHHLYNEFNSIRLVIAHYNTVLSQCVPPTPPYIHIQTRNRIKSMTNRVCHPSRKRVFEQTNYLWLWFSVQFPINSKYWIAHRNILTKLAQRNVTKAEISLENQIVFCLIRFLFFILYYKIVAMNLKQTGANILSCF